jgi:sugar phosphate isomerase/epimerase
MHKIAAQLYTVRAHTQNFADFRETCRRIKEMGYDGVQLSAVAPEITPEEINQVLQETGLECPATHFSLDHIESDFDGFVAKHRLWKCRYPAIGGNFMPLEKWSQQNWDAFFVRFNALADRLAAQGLSLGYHNHHFEFARVNGLTTAYTMLLNRLAPSAWLEVDTQWIARGGAEPSDIIRKAAHRLPCVHLKDMTITRSSDPEKDMLPAICEVGDGNLNWPGILEACAYAGVQWYIVERDDGEMEAFDSLARSLDNLRNRMGL